MVGDTDYIYVTLSYTSYRCDINRLSDYDRFRLIMIYIYIVNRLSDYDMI